MDFVSSMGEASTHLLNGQTATANIVLPYLSGGVRPTIVSITHMLNGLNPFGIGYKYDGGFHLILSILLAK